MQGTELANQVVIADDKPAGFTFELYVLRLAAEDRMFKNSIASSERRSLLDHRVTGDLGASADNNFGFDYGVGTDSHPGSDGSPFANDRARMNGSSWVIAHRFAAICDVILRL